MGKGMTMTSSKVTKGEKKSKAPSSKAKAPKNPKAKKAKRGMKGMMKAPPSAAPSPEPTPAATFSPVSQNIPATAAPSPEPSSGLSAEPSRPAPTPAPTLQTIAAIIDGEPDLTILSCVLQRASGGTVEFDFRLIFNGTFPFPFSRRNLLFQQDNPFRTNDLLNHLDEPGSDFTFFAPRNSAFIRTSNRLLTLLIFYDDFLPHLEDLLLYHGLEGGRFISDFANPDTITTLNLEQAVFRGRNPLRVNGIAAVVEPNIDASNGVVHKIQGVLAPAWVGNSLLDLTNSIGNLSIVLELLVLSGLESALGGTIFDPIENVMPSSQGTQGLTLLAPTNDAFNALDGPTDLPFLRDPANGAELEQILKYHIVDPGVFTSPRLINGANLTTASGDVVVSVIDEIVMFNQATATSESILANNGVQYVINAVLNPQSVDGF
jgi:uncharacterized surface protein with fasciclin (FAS1) repeats